MNRDVKCINSVVVVQDVIAILSNCSHNAFPVVAPLGTKYFGTIPRDLIIAVLTIGRDHNIFLGPTASTQVIDSPTIPFPVVSKTCLSCRGKSIDAVHGLLSQEERSSRINLTPYVNTSAFSVREGTTL